MVICLEQGADLHVAQRISLPLTVSCFSKIQIGFTFLVPAHLVYVCVIVLAIEKPEGRDSIIIYQPIGSLADCDAR